MQDIGRGGKHVQQNLRRDALAGDHYVDDAQEPKSTSATRPSLPFAGFPVAGWILVLTACVVLVTYYAVPPGGILQRIVGDLAFLVTSGLAAIVCLRTATRLGAAGRSWRWLGLGCVAWFGGQLVWSGYELVLRVPVPYPSVADIGFLLFYPLAVTAVVSFILTTSPDIELEMILDGMIVGAAASLLGYELLLRPLWQQHEGNVPALVSSLLWQGGAVGLLALAVVSPVWTSNPRDRRSRFVLLAALFVLSIANVNYGRLALEGTYSVGSPLDFGWHIGFLLLATAGLVAVGDPPAVQRAERPIGLGWRLVGSIGSVLAFGGLAAYAAAEPRQSNVLPIGFALVALLIAARLAYAALQANRLALRTRQRDRLAAEVAAQEATQVEMAAALNAQQQANDELARLNKSKSDFVTTVSHEFRTPLTSIQGYSELIALETETVAEAQAFARTINKNAVRLARMISDLLDLDRIESGHMVPVLEDADLNELARRVLDDLRPTTLRHTLQARLADDLPTIECDPDLMIRVITNLVANAIKYSPAGGPVIVTTGLRPGSIELSVADEGLGVPKEHREAIFARYGRIERTEQQGIEGSGLGLPIARQIVELHGGAIWTEPNAPKGSIFRVVLPTVAAVAAPTSEQSGNVLSGAPRIGS
jgi:signal transduction histidine kinase